MANHLFKVIADIEFDVTAESMDEAITESSRILDLIRDSWAGTAIVTGIGIHGQGITEGGNDV